MYEYCSDSVYEQTETMRVIRNVGTYQDIYDHKGRLSVPEYVSDTLVGRYARMRTGKLSIKNFIALGWL
jgi:hypothetical protein